MVGGERCIDALAGLARRELRAQLRHDPIGNSSLGLPTSTTIASVTGGNGEISLRVRPPQCMRRMSYAVGSSS